MILETALGQRHSPLCVQPAQQRPEPERAQHQRDGQLHGELGLGLPGLQLYTLQESVNGGAWSTVYSGGGKSKAFSGKKVASYRYRVRASNSGGSGPWSATKTVTVAIITKVTGLTAQVRWVSTGLGLVANASPVETVSSESTDVSPTMMPPPPEPTYAWFLTASWNGATGATRYEVRATDTTTGAVKSFSVTTLSIPATEVSHSTQSVTARACGASGCSAWSSAVTAVKQ